MKGSTLTIIYGLIFNFYGNMVFGQSSDEPISPLFRQIASESSGLHFENTIKETNHLNYYTFMHIYMGAGVAVGDFNNDGLSDIYFVANLTKNKLYLNKGELRFEDISEKAGVEGYSGFYTGVTTVDINQDGYLDIYVCRSGPEGDLLQSNLLYINNGDLTFSEKAFSYGLSEDYSHSTQASFFDYDKDGDLDMYLVNTPVNFDLTDKIVNTDIIYSSESAKQYGGNDKLFRNNGRGSFTDVSDVAGIKRDIFFGLAVSVGDLNNDSWPDIFVSNDFSGPDFCYINNGDGSFTEANQKAFAHTSMYSMGSDVSDLNNDGFLDLMVLDMLPKDYKRSKTSMTMMPREVMANMIESGYHKQYMHNMVQLNNGLSGREERIFKEIGQYTGLQKTDWSWSCLLADFDLDGYNDVHVTNGILRDVTNVDSRMAQKEFIQKLRDQNNYDKNELLKAREFFPSVKLKNYLFRNNGDLTFQDISENNVGLASFSNGSAVADFDNDGDLDIVCNNINEPAFLFENLASEANNYLKVSFIGPEENKRGIGVRVKIKSGDLEQIKELHITRGYFSSSDDNLFFGLGQNKKVNHLEVIWPDNKIQLLRNVKSNQKIELDYRNAKEKVREYSIEGKTLLLEDESLFLGIKHNEKPYDDFQHQLLLPHKLSALGPAIAKGDFNGDGLEDVFMGGASGFAGELHFQTENGKFKKADQPQLENDKMTEDVGAAVFDADSDGDLDIYVVSGSYEFEDGNPALLDRLYFNDGLGNMKMNSERLPEIKTSGSCVVPFDLEGDGDLDLFIGGRSIQGKYPYDPTSYVLENVSGKFTDVTEIKAREVQFIGMVTDGISVDFDKDGDQDLVMVGEWMPITFIENRNGNLLNVTDDLGMSHTSGWWNTIELMDIDNDGDQDFLAGNLGLNYKFKASQKKPFHVYAEDLDGQGVIDVVLAKEIEDQQFPIRGKMCSSQQMPFINTKFPTFNEFAEADVYDIYGSNLLEAVHKKAYEFRSSFVVNNGDGTFTLRTMPNEMQFAPVNAFLVIDINGDGHKDIISAGNLLDSEVETTPGDAGVGLVMLGDSKGRFKIEFPFRSGFFEPGNVKSLESITTARGEQVILVGKNNEALSLYRLK